MSFIRPHAERTIAPAGITPAPTDFDQPPSDPVAWAMRWLDEAMWLPVPNPNALYLATTSADGRPSVRTVLLRSFDAQGAVFFTNRQSDKGQALEATHRAAMLMHWDHLDRQLRIEGAVSHTTDAESDAYFAQRPRDSQLNAWASDQSRPVPDMATMRERQRQAHARFEWHPVPRPPHWGGYRIALERIEFWQGDPYRFHDRVVYARSGTTWTVTRLMP
jgi:pyridoxamine 5'-phosphate oxidase